MFPMVCEYMELVFFFFFLIFNEQKIMQSPQVMMKLWYILNKLLYEYEFYSCYFKIFSKSWFIIEFWA